MRWYRTLLLSANVVCLLIISSWYFEFNPKPYILPRQSILLNRNELRLIKLYEKYKLLLNLTAFKGNPLAEKTMIYSCQSFCGGWGDRLRGIISVYVLALLTDRRFLMDMNYPCGISKVLEPNFVNWTYIKSPTSKNRKQLTINTMRSWQKQYRTEIANTIKSKNLVELWSSYDDIFISTNGDYMILALRNSHMIDKARSLFGRIPLSQATMQTLFPFLYELLFKPSIEVRKRVDTILSSSLNRHLICLHIRVGKNPTNPFDHAFTGRVNTTQAMLSFTDDYLSKTKIPSLVFVTSDSGQAISDVLRHYPNSSMTIVGPILHIDRFDRRSSTVCDGFIKVLADFYMLGECQTSLLSASGFSTWANRRREKPHEELYIYNEKAKQLRKN
jgi:hypothetical protein